ncbi:hypothetical protein B9Q06_09940 [Candidatus Marsarchaeota G2 archaeon ECH_B_2]|uniref:Uncharacterized protein n=3 Tax=Candidatus Marsarchaeota group 2 TaxID=2203771 RepID=A0A2R6B6J4_9ARCH|nr:MAG: hypothetical protein B9Q06_09940 [Candidatus Marsarchaeota G2 archaeon ECH_B_2]PSN98738.1 MAG: hypothetical protein B9Q07_08925 [Candidatus Marsarchaeota G2 archaeon ECH_B_3]PSO00663.1 MAG: hypothetical protein B9Q05_10135 [Candidatus Marsarchaeota G2 archaeon ECH_B_1]
MDAALTPACYPFYLLYFCVDWDGGPQFGLARCVAVSISGFAWMEWFWGGGVFQLGWLFPFGFECSSGNSGRRCFTVSRALSVSAWMFLMSWATSRFYVSA